MLKKIINECRFTLTLETKGPFLIRDGRYEKEKGRKDEPDNIPIRRGKFPNKREALQDNQDYYIPGTSLRGVIRSHAEKIVRTIIEDENVPLCCDPFDDDEESTKVSCSKRMEDKEGKRRLSIPPYASACVICKLFGCTSISSRIQIHDSIIKSAGDVVDRDGIGIDRFTGGVSTGANFMNQVLEGYTFQSEITIRNFELWQLGLLAYVFRDFEQELVTVGFGKTKGFGRMKGEIGEVELTYCRDNQNQLKGIAELCSDEAETYDLVQNIYDSFQADIDKVKLVKPEKDFYRTKFSIQTNQNNGRIVSNDFWMACAKSWNESVKIGTDGKRKFKTIPELKALQQSTEGEGENG